MQWNVRLGEMQGEPYDHAHEGRTTMLPCPHCGHEDAAVVVVEQQPIAWAVRGSECRAIGPHAVSDDPVNAITAWNQTGQADSREMRGKVDKVELVTNALRDSLMAYRNLDGPDAALAIVALFGVTHSKRTAPLLEDLARSVQPAAPNVR